MGSISRGDSLCPGSPAPLGTNGVLFPSFFHHCTHDHFLSFANCGQPPLAMTTQHLKNSSLTTLLTTIYRRG